MEIILLKLSYGKLENTDYWAARSKFPLKLAQPKLRQQVQSWWESSADLINNKALL